MHIYIQLCKAPLVEKLILKLKEKLCMYHILSIYQTTLDFLNLFHG